MNSIQTFHDGDALESRLALRLAAGLSERTAALSPDIGERLRIAREQAVARARSVRTERAPVVVAAAHGSAVLAGGPPTGWHKLASLLPLFVLVSGLLLIRQCVNHEQVVAAAEIDSVLLADDLPPTAYTDPGFAEYLKSPPP